MPYRITMSWDMPDYLEGNRMDGVRKAVQSLHDADEAVAKQDGEINDYDVEWYGDAVDELSALGWTWVDEEMLQELLGMTEADPGWDADQVSEWLHVETNGDLKQEQRIFNEWDRRTAS